MAERLAPLYQTIDSRVSNFPKVLKLHGRLEILSEQIKMRSKTLCEHEQDSELVLTPRVVFDERDDASDNDESGAEHASDIEQ